MSGKLWIWKTIAQHIVASNNSKSMSNNNKPTRCFFRWRLYDNDSVPSTQTIVRTMILSEHMREWHNKEDNDTAPRCRIRKTLSKISSEHMCKWYDNHLEPAAYECRVMTTIPPQRVHSFAPLKIKRNQRESNGSVALSCPQTTKLTALKDDKGTIVWNNTTFTGIT